MEKNKKESLNFLDEIKKAYEFMIKNNLDVVEYSNEDEHIKLVRKTAKAENIQIIANPQPNLQIQTQNNVTGAIQSSRLKVEGLTINAPLSGIFYRASSPSSPPYVREGDIIEADVPVCLIEAMKVFNEIKSEYKCKILKCLVENGKFVNEGDPLFLVEKL